MERQIYKVCATHIVVSESHPEGTLTDISNYPMPFDSRSYNATAENPNGDAEVAFFAAQAEYSAEVLRLMTANNPTRKGWVVSIIRGSDGKEIARKAEGGFPDMTPTPEPQPEPEEEQ